MTGHVRRNTHYGSASTFNAFNARSDTTSAAAHQFTNPWLWSAIARTLLPQVAVVNLAFGMVPLDFNQCRCARGWPSRCCGTANFASWSVARGAALPQPKRHRAPSP